MKWYESDADLLMVEKMAMSRLFPNMHLDILDDKRLYWHGIIKCKAIENVHILVVYGNNHSWKTSDIKVYFIEPDIREIDSLVKSNIYYCEDSANEPYLYVNPIPKDSNSTLTAATFILECIQILDTNHEGRDYFKGGVKPILTDERFLPQIEDNKNKPKMPRGPAGFLSGDNPVISNNRAITKQFTHSFMPHSCGSQIYSSIYAPAEISREDFMLIQVYLYKDDEQEKVAAKAKEVDPDAVRKNFTPLDVPVKKGDKVTAHLQMSGKGLELDETDIDMIWQDHYTDCQFSVYVPENYKPQSLVGTVTLSVNGAPAGRMTFKSKIVDAPRSLYAEIVSHKFNKIFISYSHLDEEKVKFIHQAYEALNVDHFFDRAYLKPGDVYPEKIKNYIASADLFILCWSENAKNSDYVHLEIEDAMKRAYPGIDMDKATLAIHPLDIDPHAELPEEMNKVYNFGRI